MSLEEKYHQKDPIIIECVDIKCVITESSVITNNDVSWPITRLSWLLEVYVWDDRAQHGMNAAFAFSLLLILLLLAGLLGCNCACTPVISHGDRT